MGTIRTDRTNQKNHARSHPPRFWLWLSLIVIQIIGLALVIAATPFISEFAQSVASTVHPLSKKTLDDLALASIIFFFILVIGNGLVIQSMWRLHRWPLYYLMAKLTIALILIISVCCNIAAPYLLFFVVPLSCSLSYMILTYQFLIRHKKTSNTSGNKRPDLRPA